MDGDSEEAAQLELEVVIGFNGKNTLTPAFSHFQ